MVTMMKTAGSTVDADSHVSARGNLVIEPNEKSVWQEFPFPMFVAILYLGLGFALWPLASGLDTFLDHTGVLFNSRLVLRPPQALFPSRLPLYPIGRHSLPLHGLHMGLWHPGWILFLTIPIYYAMVKPIDRAYRRRRGINAIEIERDDDDDDIDDD